MIIAKGDQCRGKGLGADMTANIRCDMLREHRLRYSKTIVTTVPKNGFIFDFLEKEILSERFKIKN